MVEAGLHGDFARGWDISQKLAAKFPDNNRAAFNRAWYLMMQGHLLAGMECLGRGRWVSAFGDAPLPTDKPIYHGEPLQGKHLLLCSEGGLGDEIINARFARDFAERGAKVTITCDRSLASVFARIDGVSSVVWHKGAPVVHHDYWVPAMSAAQVLCYEFGDLSGRPYLSSLPERREHWRSKIDAKFGAHDLKIGLRFYGNPKFEHEQHRKFPREGLIQALGTRPWVNLQKEESDFQLESWEDTLAVLDQLDLVITSCTSVAHASAALGKPTWILVPVLPYYLWALPGSTSPWYDSVRLFRQTRFGDWSDVFSKIEAALNQPSPPAARPSN